MRSIFSKRVLTGGQIKPAQVHFSEGTITHVTPYPSSFQSDHDLDVGDLFVMPGLVDTHVHINEPGRTDWEGFETATQAAAVGGITTLVDMPLNCLPVTTSAAALQTKLDAVTDKMWVDCGFWGGVVPDSIDDLPELLAAGVLGVKSFLIDSGIAEFPPMGRNDLERAMTIMARTKKPYLIHAELDDGTTDVEVGRRYGDFLASRPESWECDAIKLMIDLMRSHPCHVHIVHLSSASALPMILEARRNRKSLTVETCPHYLTLQADEVEDGDTLYKCCPPIRENSNREALWQALRVGEIDMIVSDHSPCLPSLKESESGDLGRAWGGIASLQLSLSLIWTEMSKRGIDLSLLGDWMCKHPARLAGLEGRKGQIAVGHQADFVVWDPDASFVVTAEMLHHRHKITPYLGRRLRGMITQTWLAGQKIVEHGKLLSSAQGRPILKAN